MSAGLTYFISNREVAIGGTTGRRIEFKKGEIKHVPKICHGQALERGLLPCTKDGTVLEKPEVHIEEAPKVRVAPEDAEEREAAIVAVIAEIVKRNDAREFTSGSSPNAQAVSTRLGWKVDRKEANEVWNRHRARLTGAQAEA